MDDPPLRIVFFGTPEFAVPALRALAAGPDRVVGVVTQPDRRVGRGRSAIAAPPVKDAALGAGLPVLQPARLVDLRPDIERWAPDLAVVVAYGRIFRPWLLARPRLGCVNVHASVLPALRGPAPIQWAVMRGARETGVSIMRLDEGVDTGPVMATATVPIGPRETAAELSGRLAELGASTLVACMAALRAGRATFTPQDESRATRAPALTREDGRIRWTRAAAEVDALVRGATPWPLAFTRTPAGAALRILEVEPADPAGASGPPGEVIGLAEGCPVIACGEGAVVLRRVHPEGRREMSGRECVGGRLLAVGMRLDEGSGPAAR